MTSYISRLSYSVSNQIISEKHFTQMLPAVEWETWEYTNQFVILCNGQRAVCCPWLFPCQTKQRRWIAESCGQRVRKRSAKSLRTDAGCLSTKVKRSKFICSSMAQTFYFSMRLHIFLCHMLSVVLCHQNYLKVVRNSAADTCWLLL